MPPRRGSTRARLVVRAGTAVLVCVLSYWVGTRLVLARQQSQMAVRSAEIESRVRGRRLELSLESEPGRLFKPDFGESRWRIVLLGRSGCTPCARQQSAVLNALADIAPNTLDDLEVWLVSDLFVVWGESDRPKSRVISRSLRYSQAGTDLSAVLDPVRPLAVLFDPQGVVQHVRAGFLPGDERALVATLRGFATTSSPQTQR